jgi:hypothetical protein
MAETAANEAAQSYAVIEQAYSKENWATVLQDGEELLRRLRQSDNAQLMGLQMRLQLLLGHTQLYGYADKAEASGFYAAVAEQSSEAALTRIAKQGLKQCAIEEAPTEQAPAKAEAEAVAPTSGSLSPATPWLTVTAATALSAATAATAVTPAPIQQAESQPLEEPAASTPASPWSEPSLVPEVVEEPELIELHQSDQFLAEDVELDWKEPTPAKPSLDKADEDLISGLMLVRIR